MEQFDERVAAAKVVCDALEAVGSCARVVKLEGEINNDDDYFNRRGLGERVSVTAKSTLGDDYLPARVEARKRIATDLLAVLPGFKAFHLRDHLNVAGWIDGVSVTVWLGIAPERAS